MKASRTPPFAVIFDFDGILFETEPLHCDAFARVLSEEGICLDWAEYGSDYAGLSDREILNRLAVRHFRLHQTDPVALLTRKNRAYSELSRNAVEPITGARELIETLWTNEIPIAICSGSRRDEIERLLTQAGLLSRFEVIVATEDVAESKPSPEGYHLARRRLAKQFADLPSDRCVVFEDAAAGITAARKAGMYAIALKKDYGHAMTASPHACITSFDEVTIGFFKSLLRKKPA